MGYYSYVFGDLKPDQKVDADTLNKLKVIFEEDEYEIYEGANFVDEELEEFGTVMPAGSLNFIMNDPLKLHDSADIFVEYIKKAKEEAGITYSGTLNIEGEANDDIWRVVVKESEVFVHRPRIIWKDEDMEKVL